MGHPGRRAMLRLARDEGVALQEVGARAGMIQHRFGAIQDTMGHLTGDRREALEEFFQGIIIFQVLEQCPDRDACPLKNGRPAQNLGIHCN